MATKFIIHSVNNYTYLHPLGPAFTTYFKFGVL